jgi:hypothetical protein
MTSSILIRLGGLAPIVGGAIYGLSGSLMSRVGTFPGTVRTVVFLLSVLAVIVALHLLQREKARYRSGVGIVFAYVVIVVLALAVGGYTPYGLADTLGGDIRYVPFVSPLGGIGLLLYLLGLLVAALGLVGLAISTLAVGVVPQWGGVALITGNPLWAVLPILIYSDTPYFSIVIWLLAGSWIVVGCAVFLAAGRRSEPQECAKAPNFRELRESEVRRIFSSTHALR